MPYIPYLPYIPNIPYFPNMPYQTDHTHHTYPTYHTTLPQSTGGDSTTPPPHRRGVGGQYHTPCYLFCFTCLHNAFMHVDMYTSFISFMRTPHGSRLKISSNPRSRKRECCRSRLTQVLYISFQGSLKGESYLKVVAEPVPSPSLDPCAELLFSAYIPYIGLAEATCRSS